MHNSLLLHPDYLKRWPLKGSSIAESLQARAEEIITTTSHRSDAPNDGLSILIRTRNDEQHIGTLLADIQQCSREWNQAIEIIVVDTESQDRTLEIVEQYATSIPCTVVPLRQTMFTYPRSLNVGFDAAKYSMVLTLVGHSALTTRASLLVAQLYAGIDNLAGVHGWSLPSDNASISELLFVRSYARTFTSPPKNLVKTKAGAMAANSSLVKRKVWKLLRGYDEAYGAGGEDLD